MFGETWWVEPGGGIVPPTVIVEAAMHPRLGRPAGVY